MLLSKRKICCIVLISLLLICLAALSGWLRGDEAQLITIAHAAERQNQLRAGSNEKIRELLKERYNVLKTIVDDMNKLFDYGQHPGITELREATVAMFYAKADLCTTGSERIKVYEKLVDFLRKQEEGLAREVAIGQRNPTEILRTKAVRLEAQIRLEKQRLAQGISQ